MPDKQRAEMARRAEEAEVAQEERRRTRERTPRPEPGQVEALATATPEVAEAAPVEPTPAEVTE